MARFAVWRTSLWDEDTPPVKGATKEQITRIDHRTCKSFKEFDDRGIEKVPFTARGENHRVIRDPRGGAQGIARDFPNDADEWFIDINSLDELLAFADEHGDLILTRVHRNSDYREIEIYDGYRE